MGTPRNADGKQRRMLAIVMLSMLPPIRRKRKCDRERKVDASYQLDAQDSGTATYENASRSLSRAVCDCFQLHAVECG